MELVENHDKLINMFITKKCGKDPYFALFLNGGHGSPKSSNGIYIKYAVIARLRWIPCDEIDLRASDLFDFSTGKLQARFMN